MRTSAKFCIGAAALCLAAAGEVVAFKDAAKIKSWDAWQDHQKAAPRKEKPSVTWMRLNKLDPGLKEIGRLPVRNSKDVKSSKWSVGCETMDRDYADWDAYKHLIAPLGVKHGRLFSGWAKTEQEKGKYDFTWFDPHVREMAAMGVKPWICLAYGNPVWGSDFRLGMRVKQVTGNPEAFEAWLRYCTACVERYKDVVDEWEIWNEPFGQGLEYAEMFYRTAKAIRAVQPDARIFCTAVTFPKDYVCVLKKLKKENALDLASYFIYHPYEPNPDKTYEKLVPELRKLVKSYSESFDIMQGEVGCPAQLEFDHALNGIEWSEYAQAKWLLRRTIGDAARSIPSSVFTMIDLQYTFMLQSFGLVRSNTLKEFVYRRPSYFAMQNVFGLIDDEVRPDKMGVIPNFKVTQRFDPRDKRARALTSVRFMRDGQPIWFFWFSDSRPSSDLGFDRVTVNLPWKLNRPVWVEMITGRVFEIPESSVSHEDGRTLISDMPVWDSPVMVAEPDALRARNDRPREWRLIKRDINNWHRLPNKKTGEQAANAQACILPGDTDPLVVVLRRTRALLDDLVGEGADLAAERRELDAIAAEADKTKDEESRVAIFERVQSLNRRISLKNPLLAGIDRLLFVTHEPRGFNGWRDGAHMCDQYYGFHGTQNGVSRGDGLYILENPFSEKPVARNILAGKKIVAGEWKGQTLDGCAIISPDIDWDGKRIAFAAVRPTGAEDLDKWTDATCYHVFTCNIDGSDLRQLTSGPWNEFDPCWLPNGRIVFTSERRGGYVRCSENRPVPSYTLYSMFPDGTDIVRLSHHETNEWHPSVNNDGMIVYTRWDYVDRGAGQAHHAWTCFPDGRDPRELNGNTRLHANTTPKMEMNVRQIPGSGKYVATATPHHGWAAGSLILIDPSVPDDGEMSAVRRITPEQPFPESELLTWHNRFSGSYATAWPLGEKYFICTYDGDANGLYDVKMRGRRYAITLVDVFGNKTRLYAHPTISCLDPMPIRARKRPPVIPHKTLEGAPADADGQRPKPIPASELPKTGEIGLINVYDTRIPFPTNDAITALRVWQLFPKTAPLQQRPWLGAENRQLGRQCLGTVPVEADGSAYFTAPAGVPLFFQAIRADGCAVQNMRSDTYLHPGERLVCSGCHEPKENVRRTAMKALPVAMRREPSAIKPGPDGSAPFNYRRLVQPVLDAKCVRCHGAKRNPKAPDLRAGDWRKNKWGFLTSWNNLVHRTNYFVRERLDKGQRVEWEFFEPAYTAPGKYLAIGAPLRKMLDAGHHGVKLTPEERARLILWMDSNGQYIAHDHDPEAQRDGKIVRPALE